MANKKNIINTLISRYNPDVLCLQETHTHLTLTHWEYTEYRHDRQTKGGGVMTLVKKCLPQRLVTRKTPTLHGSIEEVTVDVAGINILNYYVPPSATLNLTDLKLTGSNIVIGDFNSHSLEWSKMTDKKGESLSIWADSNNLVPVNHPGIHTRPSSKTSPDVIFADRSFYIDLVGVIPYEDVQHTSDHIPLIAEIDTLRNLRTARPKTCPRVLWDFETADWDGYRETIKKRLTSINLNKGATYLSKVFCKSELEAAKANRRRRVKSRGNYKRHWRHDNEDTLKDKGDQLSSQLSRGSGFTFAFRKIKEMESKASENISIPASSDKDLADRFCEKFLLEDNGDPLQIDKDNPTETSFTYTELNNAIQRTPLGKAPGPDGIHPIMLRMLPEEARRVLLQIVNKSWAEGVVPKNWKEGVIRPVHKPGKPKHEMDSYRPITLTSFVGKIAERMIYDRLSNWLTCNEKLSSIQSGFRRGRNTCEQVSILLDAISRSGNAGQSSVMVAFDFTAAFDRINHRILIDKMRRMGIPTQYIKWVTHFLSNREARVYVNGTFSGYRKVRRGVPQGSILGPLLYILYVDDLCRLIDVDWATSALYADDTAVVTTGTPREATRNAQNMIDMVAQWCAQNDMLLSTSKTCVMCCGFPQTIAPRLTFNCTRQEKEYLTDRESVLGLLAKDGPQSDTVIASGESITKIDGCPVYTREQLCEKLPVSGIRRTVRIESAVVLPMKDSLRYLGITIDKNLWFNEQTGSLVTSIRRGSSLLRNLMRFQLRHHTLSMIKELYIISKVSYALESYGKFLSQQQIKTVNVELNKVARLITGCGLRTRILPLLWEAGILPFQLIITKQIRTAYFRNKSMTWCRGTHSLSNEPWASNIPRVYRDIELAPIVQPDSVEPWIETPNIKISPSFGYNKSGDSEKDKRRFLDYVNTLPPAAINIYVDGSYSPDGKAGAAIVAVTNSEVHTFSASLVGADCSYKAEMLTLCLLARRLLRERSTLPHGIIRVFTDSKSCLEELNLGRSRQRKMLPFALFEALRKIGRQFHLQFIPAHVGIARHDLADKLAKEASLTRKNRQVNDGDFFVYKSRIKRECKRAVINNIDPYSDYGAIVKKTAVPRYPLGMPRGDEIRIASFRTGSHHLLQKGIHGIRRCHFCDQAGADQRHLLFACERIDKQRKRHLGPVVERFRAMGREPDVSDLLMKTEQLQPVAKFIHWLELAAILANALPG
eukprot:TRINITY_DN741_c0_g1_i4.p1 TRINITY_DN741_c0_g1~~TRINITY_DN741_c0_g1_i4.p1  ORF type:complete len:1222 (+),score=65.98 TRINITY_DN741_c0_g1_i4:1817-5482(+)